MAYTPPTTVATNDVIGATQINTDWVDNITFLANPPRVSAYLNGDLTVATGSETILTLNAEHFDSDSMHSTSVSTGRLTAATAGLYAVTLSVFFTGATTGYRNCRIWKNGVGVTLEAEATNDSPSSTTNTALLCQKLIELDVGEYVEASVLHTRGSNLNVLGSSSRFSYFQALWVATT